MKTFHEELELAFSRFAIEADEGGLKPDVTACDPIRVAAFVELAMFRPNGGGQVIPVAKGVDPSFFFSFLNF